MAETYFDTCLGELIVGEAALAERLEQSEPGDIRPLHELLTTPDFSYTVRDFQKAPVDDWALDDYRAYGSWLLGIVQSGDGPPRLTRQQLQRAYYLGLGPDDSRISQPSRFGSITQFKLELGMPSVKISGLYDDWTFAHFVRHARQLAEKLGRKPTMHDYDALSHRHKGPSYQVIQERVGGVGPLHDAIGYPDVRRWDTEDFILWGVQVMKSNEGTLDWVMPDILAKARRGPSQKAIIDHFASWSGYKWRVEQEFERQTAIRRAKITTYRQAMSSGQLPGSLWHADTQEVLRTAGIYTLASTLLPAASVEAKLALAATPSDGVISRLRQHNNALTTDAIERTASVLHLTEDIWRYDETPYLHVPVTVIADTKRRHHQKKVARTKRLKRSA